MFPSAAEIGRSAAGFGGWVPPGESGAPGATRGCPAGERGGRVLERSVETPREPAPAGKRQRLNPGLWGIHQVLLPTTATEVLQG